MPREEWYPAVQLTESLIGVECIEFFLCPQSNSKNIMNESPVVQEFTLVGERCARGRRSTALHTWTR